MLKDRILEEAKEVIGSDGADAIEVVVNRTSTNLLRFSGSFFHQGVSCSDCGIFIRAIIGKKVGVACTNRFDKASLKECLRQAVSIAEHVKEEPFLIKLPSHSSYSEINSYFEPTASITDKEKVSILSKGFKEASKYGAAQSGAFTTVTGELAVLNSNGIVAYHPYTTAHLNIVSTKEDASGARSGLEKDLSALDIRRLMSESVERCLAAAAPKEIEPGAYRAILEPAAVSELIHWLSYTGFGSKNFHEGTSFLSGRLGRKITGENVTIYDDGLDPQGLSVPFDMEGVPKKRLKLIDKGIASGVVYDTFTAALEGKRTTGHAPFPEEPEGPLPDHIFMEGGDARSGDMTEILGKGILVKSFHYVNGLVNPKETVMTGMTRHGTFFVENGKVKYPVRSLRFTENVIKAFGRIVAASKETELFPNNSFQLSSITAPYLLIDGFNFTS